jgi:hypothetical protein
MWEDNRRIGFGTRHDIPALTKRPLFFQDKKKVQSSLIYGGTRKIDINGKDGNIFWCCILEISGLFFLT